jgi:hypothetical protein
MCLPATIPATVIETILARLALLFLAATNGDVTAARQAAMGTLADYQPQTPAELRLAANAVSLSLHALEALSQAALPEMPITRILRLRGGAVSLNREAEKTERRLEKLQQGRRNGIQSEPAKAPDLTQDILSPTTENAVALIEATRQLISTPPPHWSKAQRQRDAARRITETLKRNQATHLAAAGGQAAGLATS